jgi:magnesium-transporting ATPase (P-type)
MNKGRELQRQFADTYIRSQKRIPIALRSEAARYAKHLQTVVVDTIHLTDGEQTVVGSWVHPEMGGSPMATAHDATIASTSLLMKGLHQATAISSTHVQPIHTDSGEIEWSVWHQGAEYEVVAAGSVEAITHYCDLTENEYETIMLAARRLSHEGHLVYATARSVSADQIPRLNAMRFNGLIACSLHLLPGTLHAITGLRAWGIRLVYVTSLPEETASAIAEAAHMTKYPKVARHGKFTTDLDHAIYARVDRVSSRRLLHDLPQPLLVSRHPLSMLYAMLDTFR